MNVNFVKVKTDDGIELHGVVSGKITDSTVILHIHGLAGNFYENRFIWSMAKKYQSNNLSFISFNNRGHDYIADVLKEDGGKISFLRKGGAHDHFEDCIKDIDAWLKFAKDNNAKKIILQGHSVGAAKVIYYYISTFDPNISGLVLISPSDDISWGKDELGDKFKLIIDLAKKMINEGKEGDLIPYKSFSYPMDAQTFLDTFEGKTPQSMFHFPTTIPKIAEKLGTIQLPIFITLGTVNEAYSGEPKKYLENLKKLFKKSKIKMKIIEDAGHTYIGYEDKLTDEIIHWTKEFC